MTRSPRHILPGQPLHITQRGHNRMPVFEDPVECRYCLRLIGEISVKHRCAIHAYVLMGNHLHLLTTPSDTQGPRG